MTGMKTLTRLARTVLTSRAFRSLASIATAIT